MRSYVLDQYKEVLFPKQISKFEKAHNAAMDRQKEKEMTESKEVRSKILALAQMMQYDDDVEESAVTQNMQLSNPGAPATTSTTNEAKPKDNKGKQKEKNSAPAQEK